MSFCFNDKYVFNINQSHVKKKHQKWAEYMLTQMIHFCKWKQHMDPLFGTRSHIKTTHRSPWDIPETPTGDKVVAGIGITSTSFRSLFRYVLLTSSIPFYLCERNNIKWITRGNNARKCEDDDNCYQQGINLYYLLLLKMHIGIHL
ncbi:hypothetical protein Hdeb2414_s0002g00074991 [Helianthus debilis subsp. tardiflorus]